MSAGQRRDLGAPQAATYRDGDRARPVLVWRFARPRLAASTTAVGGGIGIRHWVINAQVDLEYARTDLDAHVAGIAAELGCTGVGVGFLTAAPIDRLTTGDDSGVTAYATVGLRHPTWAADADGATAGPAAGTINVVVDVPARLSDSALLNALVTATEAKTQALIEAGVPGTGTASDAACVMCPPDGPAGAFAGPRSEMGAALARAVHRAVSAGTRHAWPPGERDA